MEIMYRLTSRFWQAKIIIVLS